MTRYEALAKPATDQATRRRDEHNRCARFAARLMGGLADYLECPQGTASFAWLGPDLAFGETQGSVRDSRPRMRPGKDGFWYFAIRLHFRVPTDASIFYDFDGCYGLKDDGDGFILRGGQDVRLDPADASAIESFYEEAYQGLTEKLGKPFAQPSRRFGFAPAESRPAVFKDNGHLCPAKADE